MSLTFNHFVNTYYFITSYTSIWLVVFLFLHGETQRRVDRWHSDPIKTIPYTTSSATAKSTASPSCLVGVPYNISLEKVCWWLINHFYVIGYVIFSGEIFLRHFRSIIAYRIYRCLNWCEGIASSGCGRRCHHRGYDQVFAVNYLGHFLLVNQLLPLLVHAAPSRIVSVASISHTFLRESLFDEDTERVGDGGRSVFCRRLTGYDASKLAMVLHVKELTRRLAGLRLILSLSQRLSAHV